MSELTLDEAIKHCLEVAENNEQFASGKWIGSEGEANRQECEQCAADHRQLAEWLMELKQWRRVYGVCPSYEMCIPECKEGYNAQIAEYKRLLKTAVEDFRILGTMLEDGYGHCTAEICCDECVLGAGNLADDCQWRHEAEALKLIGDDEDGKI